MDHVRSTHNYGLALVVLATVCLVSCRPTVSAPVDAPSEGFTRAGAEQSVAATAGSVPPAEEESSGRDPLEAATPPPTEVPAQSELAIDPPAEEPVDNPAAEKPTANRLADETSPYLLLHAHNPVHWYPWGEEALAKAKNENKLIFLSIGYSSCYWCHVMERESFLDEEIAAFLNEHYVAVKVDREERPDIDKIYMTALQVYLQLRGGPGRGGWPMSMFLSPDAKPILGGTYYPPRDSERGIGFITVLQRVNEIWQKDPDQFRKAAAQLSEFVVQQLDDRPALGPPKSAEEIVDSVEEALSRQFDPQHGGFGYSAANPRQPKFPEPSNLLFLLERARQDDGEEARRMLVVTLQKMARGGIRDHLGGGFHRYSTDRYWRIPHFEKMLYDNAQLATVYAEAYALTGDESFRRVVEEILQYVTREMTDPGGAFYSALDAETDAEEGRYYAWEQDEFEEILTAGEWELFKAVYIGQDGANFEGRFVPLLARPLEEVAAERGGETMEWERLLSPIREKLLTQRAKRERPLTDTKILTAWNGLMIRGFADAGRLLKEEKYVQTAARAAEFVLGKLRDPEGRLLRTYGGERAKLNAYLDDYAFLIDGLIALDRATPEEKWRRAAGQLMAKQLELFWDDKRGGFYFTSHDHEQLLARSKDPIDSVLPSGNAVTVGNLVYLAEKLDRPEYLDRAKETIKPFAGYLSEFPSGMPRMALAVSALEKVRPQDDGVSDR